MHRLIKAFVFTDKGPRRQPCSTFCKDAQETLIPDLISIVRSGAQTAFVIFDAKYYCIQLEPNRPVKNQPGVGDVTKQYLYQLAYHEFTQQHDITHIRNCFLMPTEDAKKRIADKKMPPDKRAEYLIPFTMTDILFEQMMNLVRDTDKNRNSQLIILDQSNTRIRKDKFSALLYALAYCQRFDERHKNRKGVGQNRWMMFSKG